MSRVGLIIAIFLVLCVSEGVAADTFMAQPDFLTSGERLSVATSLEPAEEPSVVDIGFFYAQELQERGRSLAQLDATARGMVEFMNTALADSNVALTIRLVYAGVFEERLDGINTSAAHSLLGETGRRLRDTLLSDYGMDAIVLLKATDDVDEFFGIATLGTETSLSDTMTVPHAVVCLGAAPNSGLECFGRGGIFAHEAGHLFGAGHQHNAPGGSGGAFSFSFASACAGGTIVFSPVSAAQRIFSTPAIVVDNEPCGVEDEIDNARTIDLTRALMADLRATMPIDGEVFIDGPTEFALTEGDPPVTTTLRRDGNLDERARVRLAVISRIGVAPDVVIDPIDAVFEPGQESIAVELTVIDDAAFETEEIIEIGPRNPWRLATRPGSIKLTVTDNDAPPPPPPPSPGSGGGGGTNPVFLLWLVIVVARRCR